MATTLGAHSVTSSTHESVLDCDPWAALGELLEIGKPPDGYKTTKEIAQHYGINHNTARHKMKELNDAGKVHRIKYRSQFYYGPPRA